MRRQDRPVEVVAPDRSGGFRASWWASFHGERDVEGRRPPVDPLHCRKEGLAAEHVEPGDTPFGRTPSSTIHQVPSGASTRSAWPVF